MYARYMLMLYGKSGQHRQSGKGSVLFSPQPVGVWGQGFEVWNHRVGEIDASFASCLHDERTLFQRGWFYLFFCVDGVF